MEVAQVVVAFTAKEFDISKDLGFVTDLAETAVFVLHVMGCKDGTVSNLYKIAVIPT
jgi:hypothetical protein